MRPLGQNLATKGIVGTEKGLTLITKGMLDLLVRVGEPIARPRQWVFNIVGKKQIAVVDEFNSVGQKLFDFDYTALMEGLVQSKIEYKNEFKGKKLYDIKNNFSFKGKKWMKNINEMIVVGSKNIPINTYTNLIGYKHYTKKLDALVTAQKKYDINNIVEIKGAKKIKLDTKILIKGKRDILPIIIALE